MNTVTILTIIFIIIIAPLLTIWSLNTLFPVLAINYGIAEWLAVLLLFGTINARKS